MATAPEFDDDGLTAIAASFLSRSKAITYHAKGWTMSRETEESERLNIDAEGFHGQLRLSVWPERIIWFRLCRGLTEDGWEFLLAFNGNASAVANGELVEMVVASMTVGINQLTDVWRDTSPEIERYEPTL